MGNLGENLALKHLKSKGYRIIERNFRSKHGEIDIIAQDGKILVFIEVKTRRSQKFGSSKEAITPLKIKRMVKVSQSYQSFHPNLPDSVRLDAVVIDFSQNRKLKKIEIVKNLTFHSY